MRPYRNLPDWSGRPSCKRCPTSGGEPKARHEMARHVALVGKARRGGGFAELRARGDHRLRPRQSASDLIAMRRGPGSGAEVASQREPVEPGYLLELLRADGAVS